jgi:mono/diheme cytochrome c family protein
VLAFGACQRGPPLDPEVGARPLPSSAARIDDALADAGAWYFRRNCAACHMVGGEQELIGPNLDGVTERREMTWIAAMIRRPDSMIVSDSIAAALFAEYQVPMANRRLDAARIRAILEFLWRADHGPSVPETTPGEGRDTGAVSSR